MITKYLDKMKRQLTEKETAKSVAGLCLMILLASVPDEDYSTLTLIRLFLAIIVGIAVAIYQRHCMNSIDNEEDGE